MFLAAKQVEQRHDDGKLPMKDPCGCRVEAVDVDGQGRKKIGEKRDGHAGSCKA